MAVGSAKRVEISILPVIAVAQYPCTKNAQEPKIKTKKQDLDQWLAFLSISSQPK
jgi:hypothetical protein